MLQWADFDLEILRAGQHAASKTKLRVLAESHEDAFQSQCLQRRLLAQQRLFCPFWSASDYDVFNPDAGQSARVLCRSRSGKRRRKSIMPLRSTERFRIALRLNCNVQLLQVVDRVHLAESVVSIFFTAPLTRFGAILDQRPSVSTFAHENLVAAEQLDESCPSSAFDLSEDAGSRAMTAELKKFAKRPGSNVDGWPSSPLTG